MPIVGREQLDADLATLKTNLPVFITAVQALLSNQAIIDLSAEDSTVNDLIAAVNDAQGKLPPPPV